MRMDEAFQAALDKEGADESPSESPVPRAVPVVVYQEPDTLASVSESATSEVVDMPTATRTPTRKPRIVKPKQTTRECRYCHFESIDVMLSERATSEAGTEIYFCRKVKECNARAEAQGITHHLETE